MGEIVKPTENKEKSENMANNIFAFLNTILGDISSRSAYTQMAIGTAAGWFTGFATMKIGKIAAFCIGGGIILLEIVHHEGLIEVNWSKVTKKLDKVSDKVERAVTGQERTWIDKAERYVDRKLDRAEDILKGKSKKAKKWYTKLIGDENGPKLNKLHIFLTAFIGGVALGIATS